MNKKTIIIIISIIGIIMIGALYIKVKFNGPNHPSENAKSAIKKLQESDHIKNGDIIFQTSLSKQSKAIQLATHSKYSHCGIIYKNKDKYFVFEAVEPVKNTTLENWISRGENGHYVIKRLKNAEQILTPEVIQKMKTEGEQFKGKHYDKKFEWSDTKIYCSELIWKVYQRSTGIKIGKLGKLKDFDFSNETVKQLLKDRYSNNINMDETIISPVAIFNSELLETVSEN